jgi:CheY-like chemotaxis protein
MEGISRTSSTGLRLLIVDDEPALRGFMAAAAANTGMFSAIDTVDGGAAALELIWGHVNTGACDRLPHLIVTDCNMPLVDGIELTRSLKASPATAGIPVAMLSSSLRAADREGALSAGCCAYFTRPLTSAGLVAVFRLLFSLRAA